MSSLADTPLGNAWDRCEQEADRLDRVIFERSSQGVPKPLRSWVRSMVANPDSGPDHLLAVAEMLHTLATLGERDGKTLSANALQALCNDLKKIAQTRGAE